jgi:pimeloyl-ACP methyl ester carboxylesterase
VTSDPALSRETTVTTPDGRVLKVREGGDLSGTAVFVHHGTPGSNFMDDEMTTAARARGVRLVMWSRPGYPGSTRDHGRTVGSVATDAASVADAFGVDTFLTWGVSGGGPHALACGALLPDRVPAVAVLAGVAPIDLPGLDWLDGMGQDNLDEHAATQAGEGPLREFLERMRAQMLPLVMSDDPDALVKAMASLLPPVDAAYANAHSADVNLMMVKAIEGGVDGWLDDDLAFSSPWGFDLADIRVPVLVLQGKQDLMVPFAHSQSVADAIPGAELRFLDDDGHLTLHGRSDETHDWLLAASALG